MIREFECGEAFTAFLSTKESLEGVVCQGLDLRPFEDALRSRSLRGAIFLGCTLSPALHHLAIDGGALVFPAIPGLPFTCFPRHLYTVEELYAGYDHRRPETYGQTYDARVYAHWQQSGRGTPTSIIETLSRRLHDHGITDALDELLGEADPPRQVVAIMGGHGMARDTASYRQVATLARVLTKRGFFMASGGGPGAMEATHLGAWFANRDEADLATALELLRDFPAFDANRTGQWLAPAFAVRERFPLRSAEDRTVCASLGIPTWLYGHEPPNPFATHIAKYFANSVREEGLLTIATAGIIYSPGSAGTIQEIFQDACQNHYNTVGVVSPMIFLGTKYWTETKPVYPLLAELARGHAYEAHLALTDSLDEVCQLLERSAASTS